MTFAPNSHTLKGMNAPSDTPESLREILVSNDYSAAWQGLNPAILQLIKTHQYASVLEIGGGRSPRFEQSQLPDCVKHYVSNDISQSELDRAPDWVEKSCFDICGKAPSDRYESVDFMFSCMVQEHLPRARAAYHNMYRLLKPGGMVINFFPTLFASPFVINYLLPEQLSRKILQAVFPSRNDDETPKFPAYYDWCTSTNSTRKKVQSVGFSTVHVVPFYGHGYYDKFPLIRDVLNKAITPALARADFKPLSSYAYIIAIK